MTDLANWFLNLDWYIYVGAFVWLVWTIHYNQQRYLKDLQKRDPEAYNKHIQETVNKKPWYMG